MTRKTDAETAYTRAAARCAMAEYCCADWQRKFTAQGLSDLEATDIIRRLQKEGFVDERRYAKAFAHDKAYYERWGQLKIKQALRLKGISASLIDEALDAIPEIVWQESLTALITSKKRTLKAKTPFEYRQKLLRFAAGRGYGAELACEVNDPTAEVPED